MQNTGRRAGHCVGQAYASEVSADTATGRLAGFGSTWKEPGEIRFVDIQLDARVMRRCDTTEAAWTPAAPMQLRVALSAVDDGLLTLLPQTFPGRPQRAPSHANVQDTVPSPEISAMAPPPANTGAIGPRAPDRTTSPARSGWPTSREN